MNFESILKERRVIGKVLMDKRKELGLSIYQVALDTGMQSTQIKNVELGRTAYAIDTLLHYVDYLNADIFSYFSPHKKYKCMTCNHEIDGKGFCSRECAELTYTSND